MVHEHTLKFFDADIEGMRGAVAEMGGLVERQLARAIEAVCGGDLAQVAQVLADEQVVNQLHVRSDQLCNQVIVKHQPIAIDLREVIGALHTIYDLERIGDEAQKIALKGRSLHDSAHRDDLPLDRLRAMAEEAGRMLHDALDAFLRHDTSAADRLAQRDTEVDGLRDAMNAELVRRMSADPSSISSAMELMFVVQSIERIGDHAKSIAEYVVNVVEGIDRRHGGPAPAEG